MSFSTGTFNYYGDLSASGRLTCTTCTFSGSVDSLKYMDIVDPQTITVSKTFSGGISGNLILSSSTSIAGTNNTRRLTAAQIPYLSVLKNNAVDVTTTNQVISAPITFSQQTTFTGGGLVVTGKLSLATSGGNITFGPSNNINFTTSTLTLNSKDMAWITNIQNTIMDTASNQTIGGASKRFSNPVFKDKWIVGPGFTRALTETVWQKNLYTKINSVQYYTVANNIFNIGTQPADIQINILHCGANSTPSTNGTLYPQSNLITPPSTPKNADIYMVDCSNGACPIYIPNPSSYMVGGRFTFVNYNVGQTKNTKNPLILTCSVFPNFVTDPGSNGNCVTTTYAVSVCPVISKVSGTYTLVSSLVDGTQPICYVSGVPWNKVTIVCLPNPDASDQTNKGYAWWVMSAQ